jgi:hypothetical protein
VLRRDAGLVELRVETRSVAPWHVQTEKPCVDAAFSQCGQERQKVVLGSTDPADLVEMENLHRRASSS